MKNNILILFVFLAVFNGSVFAQNGADSKGKVEVRRNSYQDGGFREAGYINGIQEGPDKIYGKKGNLRTEAFYKNGNKDGVWKDYYDNGQLRLELTYENGKVVDGLYKTFKEDGTLAFETTYQGGHPNGPERIYHKNGQLASETIYKDGQPIGHGKAYDERGSVVMEENVIGGAREIVMNSYYKSGKLKEKRTIGDKENEIKTYDETGKLLIEVNDMAQLVSPIEVVHVDSFLDGGTLAVSLKDSSGKVLRFSLEEGMFKKSGEMRFVYIGAEHPSFPGAKQIPIGGESEKRLLKLLEEWQVKSSLGSPGENEIATIKEVIKVLKSR